MTDLDSPRWKSLSIALALGGVACTGAVRSAPPEARDPHERAVDTLMARDRDGDGVLDADEAGLALFALDVDGDGRADRDEARAFVERVTGSFQWVNPPDPMPEVAGLTHATFTSPSMGVPVGYSVYLPPQYDHPAHAEERYPVVYFLPGGRPGDESRGIELARLIHPLVESELVDPVIFVWVNGGRVSYYDDGDSPGERVFVHELVPHVDATYRTIASRGGRALQGFSHGGRGAARIMFRYPELFVSAAPGAADFALEKEIEASGGIEHDVLGSALGLAAPRLDVGAGNDAYSLARAYAEHPTDPPLEILIWIGVRDERYPGTLDYLAFLESLGIPAERMIVPRTGHDLLALYLRRGIDLLRFHDRCWIR